MEKKPHKFYIQNTPVKLSSFKKLRTDFISFPSNYDLLLSSKEILI